MTEPSKILTGRYLTKSIAKKAKEEGLLLDEALKKYGKNRHCQNPKAKPSRNIKHSF